MRMPSLTGVLVRFGLIYVACAGLILSGPKWIDQVPFL